MKEKMVYTRKFNVIRKTKVKRLIRPLERLLFIPSRAPQQQQQWRRAQKLETERGKF